MKKLESSSEQIIEKIEDGNKETKGALEKMLDKVLSFFSVEKTD